VDESGEVVLFLILARFLGCGGLGVNLMVCLKSASKAFQHLRRNCHNSSLRRRLRCPAKSGVLIKIVVLGGQPHGIRPRQNPVEGDVAAEDNGSLKNNKKWMRQSNQ